MVILIIVSLFLFLLFLGGLFYYLKRRNNTKNPVNTNRMASPTSIKSDPSANEPVHTDTNTSEVSLALESTPIPTNTDFPKQQKSKRGGYSKQQFDEFE